MSPNEVLTILGDSVVIGYEILDERGGSFKPITVKNPRRTETIKRGYRTFQVVFYLTNINQSDGTITDDELTPFVFEGNRLLGWGWPYLNRILKTR